MFSYSGNKEKASLPGNKNHSFFQSKLSINQPNDVYEQEADAMADKVMRMKDDNSAQSSFFKPSAINVQRKCQHCEEEEKKQLQRKEINNDETVATSSTENYISSINGKGRSLSTDERKFFEPRFGYDFSSVQLHTNAEANQSAKNINALAYTHQNNIVFNADQYQPNSNDGKKLMAHELTHVIQQNKNIRTKKIQKQTSPTASTTTTPATPHVCGPNVTPQVSAVWSRIQSDFRGWSPVNKLAAAVYLIAPYVPAAGTNPRAAGGSTLFTGSWAEPFISIIAALTSDPILAAYVSMTNSQWQLNRDAFDTIGLFVLSASWLFSVPGCAVPGCSGLSSASLPRGESDPCEDPSTCSITVQMGSGCWLSGTVNYGTYGIMMKEVYNWCNAQRSRMLGLLPRILLLSLGNPTIAISMLRASMTDQEIAAAFIKELFSPASLTLYVGGYKLWDMENPIDPLNWAKATYNAGPTAIAAGSNRASCQPTCGPLNPAIFSGWDYVWEPVKHR